MAVLARLAFVGCCRGRLNRPLAKPSGLSACRVLGWCSGAFPPSSPLASFSFLPPGFGLAVPPGLVLGCCPWLPLPLETVFWFSGGGSPGLALGCRLAVLGGVENKKCSFFWMGLSLVFFVKERVK